MQIIDFHVHAFPDALAQRAITALSEHSGDYKPFLDGTINNVMSSMDQCGISSSIIASIATKPSQALPILQWSKLIASSRIIPFGSVHPKSPSLLDEIKIIKDSGIKGIKLHPLYQDFEVDDPSLTPLYRACQELGLIVLCHGGYDIAFPGDKRAMPIRFSRVIDRVPGLKMVVAHMGGWQIWEEVISDLCGSDVWFDTSFIEEIQPSVLENIFSRHPISRFVFASDSPWTDQAKSLAYFRAVGLSEKDQLAILGENAAKLLSLI